MRSIVRKQIIIYIAINLMAMGLIKAQSLLINAKGGWLLFHHWIARWEL